MNKNSYRIIYSKARQMFVAVAENVRSQTKTSGQSEASTQNNIDNTESQAFHQLWQVKALVASISLWMPLAPVYAGIVADSAANAANRAVIGAGKNSAGTVVPVVNIQTPKNGISHNIYKQFDVLAEGAVLNNSRQGATTKTVGSVAANPFLATGEARVILNEVNSSAASRFEGNLEVAGQMADVIIANPSGISIKGGGFINANKAIFTTGKPQLNADGSIKQFTVDQGKITVSANPNSKFGLGGNNNDANYVDLYARALELSAELRAKNDIQVIAGANNVSADLQDVTAKTGTGTAPTLAVDVKALGGMYANNIYLMGTEKGLGVTNAGTIQAVNDLVITSAGKIEHSGTISSTSKTQGLVNIQTTGTGAASDINSSGSINSNSMLNIDSGNNLNVNAKEIIINNSSLASSPLIVNTKGNINLAANTRIMDDSQGGDVYIDAANINLAAGSELKSNRGTATIQVQKDLVAAKGAKLIAAQDLNVLSNGKLSLTENHIQASLGTINLQANSANTQNLIDLQGGTIYAGKDLNLYSTDNINMKNLSFSIENNKNRVKNINIYSGGSLYWDNTAFLIPDLTGKISLRAEKDLTILGQGGLSADNGISLYGGNVNVSSLNLNSNIGNTLVFANNNIDIKGVNIKSNNGNLNFSAENGYIKIADSNLSSEKNKLFLISKDKQIFNNTSLLSGGDLILNTISNKGDVEINQDGGLFSSPIKSNNGNVIIDSKGMLNITTKDLNKFVDISGEKIEISSSNNMKLDGINVYSNGNLSLHADKDIYLNTVLPNSWTGGGFGSEIIRSQKHISISSKEGSVKIGLENQALNAPVVGLKANGVISIKSKLDQSYQNTSLNAGAITLHSDAGSINNSKNFRAIANTTFFLESDSELKKINGNLSLYAKKDIQLDAINSQGRAFDPNYTRMIKPVLSSQGLMDIRADGVFQVNGKAPPAQTAMWDQLKMDRAYFTSNDGINILAGTVKMYAGDLKNTSNTAPINIISTGDIVLDAMNYDVNIGQLDLMLPAQKLRDELEASGKKDSVTLNTINQLNEEIAFYLSRSLNGTRSQSSHIDSAQNINLLSKKGILIRASELYAKNEVNIEAQGLLARDLTGAQVTDYIDTSILVDGVHDIYKNGEATNSNYEERSDFHNSIVSGDNGINIKSTGSAKLNWYDNPNLLSNYATVTSAKPIQLKKKINDGKNNIVFNGAELISSGGDVNIQSNANIVLESSQDEIYKHSTSQVIKKTWYGKKKSTETYTQSQYGTAVPTTILAKNISLKAAGDIDFYSTLMKANSGNVNITGENLYFLTSNNYANSTSTTKKNSSILGIPLNKSKTTSSRSQISQLPVKLVGDYLSTESKNDTVFVGTEFDYMKNASVKAGGQIAFLGASETISQALKVEKSNIVWQSMQDKGSITETTKLPNFNGPTPPTFKASGGLIVQVPIISNKNNDIRAEVINLANQPGNEYLKGFIARKDVNWEAVKLAQENWDYKSQGLTAAGAAIIVIIVTIATMGSGTAAAAGAAGGTAASGTTVGLGASMIGTAGVTTTAAGAIVPSTLGVMANAAVTSLATQASISLINNGGDISKTLKDLGSKETVKNLATSVVTAGALSTVGGLDWMEKLKDMGTDPNLLVNLAGRTGGAIVEAGLSAGISSSINGGSLTDNLQGMLLSSFATALQGSLASKIGKELGGMNKTDFENILHKIAHLAAGCVAGAIQKQCESGAIGAGIGEFVAEFMPAASGNGVYSDDEKERVLAVGKILAAGVAGITGYDVNVASSSANTALLNNALSKTDVDVLIQNLKSCKNESQCRNEIQKAVLKSNYNQSNAVNCLSLLCSDNLEQAISGYNQLRGFIASGKFSGDNLKLLNNLLTQSTKDITLQINRLPQVQAYLNSPWTPPTKQQMAQIVIDILPMTSDPSAIYSIITGKAVVTQEEVSRFYAAVGLILPITIGRSLTKAEIAGLKQSSQNPLSGTVSIKDLPALPKSAQNFVIEQTAQSKYTKLLYEAKNDPSLGTWSTSKIGQKGEEIAVQLVKGSGFTDVISIQNASGNGIDIIAKNPQGNYVYLEVKTSAVGKIGSLSKRQEDMNFFVNDILTNAAAKTGRYVNISDTVNAQAKIMLTKYKQQKAVGNIYGAAIGVDLKNAQILISSWTNK
ncbi:DUF637 domain-containing protein [Acinetobacter baumannii]|uniref:two-partner secretion domain-containing protein n=1 Tax=Acinetobacter baumannii TaxID=470 RepID=UPI003AF9EFF9